MKKITLIVSLLLLIGCSKNEDVTLSYENQVNELADKYSIDLKILDTNEELETIGVSDLKELEEFIAVIKNNSYETTEEKSSSISNKGGCLKITKRKVPLKKLSLDENPHTVITHAAYIENYGWGYLLEEIEVKTSTLSSYSVKYKLDASGVRFVKNSNSVSFSGGGIISRTSGYFEYYFKPYGVANPILYKDPAVLQTYFSCQTSEITTNVRY